MKKVFATYNPLVNFIFFCGVIGFGVFLIHPVFLGIGLTGSLACVFMTEGKRIIKKLVMIFIPAIILVTVINMYVNPQGDTVLWETEFRPVTMEAMIFGLLTGILIVTVILWFSYFNKIMTSDKIIFLFGKIMPSISLIFTMVLRFIPGLQAKAKEVSSAQKCIGRDVANGSLKKRIHHGVKITSIMMTWALENSIDTADSMRARGYELKGRSSFTIYHLDRRDTVALIFLAMMIIIIIIGIITGKSKAEFYPAFVISRIDIKSFAVYAAYFAMCFMPVIIQIKEALMWKHIESKI